VKIRALLLALLFAAVLAAAPATAIADHRPGHEGGPDECSGKNKRACEIPEVPVAAALPLAGAAIIAGYMLVQRRRAANAS
jgi:hypothetical protein